jgi:uncharacterized protein
VLRNIGGSAMTTLERAVQLGPLDLLVIQPTPFCNLDCDYCYLPNRQSKARIAAQTLRRTFQRVFESDLVGGPFTVVWHAGEPLALPLSFYREAVEIMAECNQHNVPVQHSIQTNGTLINESWCSFIEQHSVRIGVSVDGPDFLHDIHRKTRGGEGTFPRVVRGINLLRHANIPFYVISVLTRDALSFPDELFDFYQAHDILDLAFNIEEIEGPHRNSSLQQSDAYARFTRFLGRFYDLNARSDRAIRLREFDSSISAMMWQGDRDQIASHQTTAMGIISVDVEGNFSTFSPELLGLSSPKYGSFTFGNVASDSFEAALRTEKFRSIAADIARGVELCRQSCAYFDYCGGGAPVNKYFENGRFDSTETLFCRFSKQAVFDVVLKKLEDGPHEVLDNPSAMHGFPETDGTVVVQPNFRPTLLKPETVRVLKSSPPGNRREWRTATQDEFDTIIGKRPALGIDARGPLISVIEIPQHLRDAWWAIADQAFDHLAAGATGELKAVREFFDSVLDFLRFKQVPLGTRCSTEVILNPPGRAALRWHTPGERQSDSLGAPGLPIFYAFNLGAEPMCVSLSSATASAFRLALPEGCGFALWREPVLFEADTLDNLDPQLLLRIIPGA